MLPRRSAAHSDRSPTRVPGIRISEHLPRLAARMDRFALIRSMHHDEAPIHETGHQLLQTGRLCRSGEEHPHLGSVAARLLGPNHGLPPAMIVPGPITDTGVKVPHGQTSGWLGAAYEPFHVADDPASPRFDPALALDRARRALDLTLNHTPVSGQVLAAQADPLLIRGRGPHSSSTPSTTTCATLTGGTRSARAACWRGGWSKPACGWSR